MSQLFLPLLYRGKENSFFQTRNRAVMQRFDMLLSLLTLFRETNKKKT